MEDIRHSGHVEVRGIDVWKTSGSAHVEVRGIDVWKTSGTVPMLK